MRILLMVLVSAKNLLQSHVPPLGLSRWHQIKGEEFTFCKASKDK
jgi:hypothetical protein